MSSLRSLRGGSEIGITFKCHYDSAKPNAFILDLGMTAIKLLMKAMMWKYWTNERQQKWLLWRYKYWEIDREPKSGTNWLVSWRKCHNKAILMKGQKYETWPQMTFESKRTTTKKHNFVGSNLESPYLISMKSQRICTM